MKLWTDEEDKQLLEELLSNKSIDEIAEIHGRIEFSIRLRIHLIIHRLHVSGLTVNEIRKKTNMSISDILGVINPVKPVIRDKNKNWLQYSLW